MKSLQRLHTDLSNLAMQPIPSCAVAVVAALLNPLAAVQAAEARAGINRMVSAGFATAGHVQPLAVSAARAYEFKAGVGVSAHATAGIRVVDGVTVERGFTSASARASFSDSFQVALDHVADIGGATSFELTVPIKADGTVDIGYTFNRHPLSPPNVTDNVYAQYTYEWSVGGRFGQGWYGRSKNAFRDEILTDTVRGDSSAVFRVSLGQQVSLSLSVYAVASAIASFGTATADVDFDHTLSWGGVSGITGYDDAGTPVVLPDGFRLSLLSNETGFDYMNAAGPNPYTTSPVPEPASWALMLAGCAGIVVAMRRRPVRG